MHSWVSVKRVRVSPFRLITAVALPQRLQPRHAVKANDAFSPKTILRAVCTCTTRSYPVLPGVPGRSSAPLQIFAKQGARTVEVARFNFCAGDAGHKRQAGDANQAQAASSLARAPIVDRAVPPRLCLVLYPSCSKTQIRAPPDAAGVSPETETLHLIRNDQRSAYASTCPGGVSNMVPFAPGCLGTRPSVRSHRGMPITA
ncbi:hypothetical protein ON010_g18952 [Phytophthora cinnamomi]|nr:hypothetical protein ON010_g18952 [Phytophthora cinnamomi]